MTRLSPIKPQPQRYEIPQDVACYEITSEQGFYGPDCHLYREGEVLMWTGVPNLDMKPLNAAAEKAFLEYVNFLDECGRKVAEKTGKAYLSHKDAYENALALSKQEAQGAVVGAKNVNGRRESKVVMGAKKDTSKMIAKLELQEPPMVVHVPKKPENSLKDQLGKSIDEKQ